MTVKRTEQELQETFARSVTACDRCQSVLDQFKARAHSSEIIARVEQAAQTIESLEKRSARLQEALKHSESVLEEKEKELSLLKEHTEVVSRAASSSHSSSSHELLRGAEFVVKVVGGSREYFPRRGMNQERAKGPNR
ncbi:MAG: hypothetical protein P4L16_04415 [Chlamydiales bacterium]|nr:hypothetical protein [Chlamydiales bacterium]